MLQLSQKLQQEKRKLMKIALECQSVLLKKALDIFLKPFIVSKKQCDFIVCDYESNFKYPAFQIDTKTAHIKKPFSKDELIEKLEEFYILTCKHEKNSSKKVSNSVLEEEIENLTKDFSQKLVNLIKAHYEN